MARSENLILTKSFDFAIEILKLYKILKENKEFDLARQVLKAGTSIGANVEEAVGAFSKKDFAAKMGISLKEARETRYWLRVLNESQVVTYKYDKYLSEIDSIINILTAIVKTSQGGNKNFD